MRAATLFARAAATVTLALCLLPGIASAQMHTDSCNPDDDCNPHPEAFDHAVFVSQSVPTSMIAGQPYAVSVTLKNTGGLTWSAPTYVLYAQNPDGNTTWGLNQVPMPYTVVDDQDVTFSFTVTAPSAPGSYNFQWGMRVNLNDFTDPAPNVVVSVVANAAPSVSLTQPASGAQFVPGATVSLAATASDSDGTVDRVEFLVDGTEIAEDASSPYAATWTATAGTHTVQARAVDNLGKTTTTGANSISVTATNVPPTVSLTAPADGAGFTTGATVAMTATASDSDGTVTRVEFLVDGAEVGEDTSSPYAFNWTATAGSHSVQARAVDDDNASTTSGSAAITVTSPGNQLPSVTLTAPANGATFAPGDAVSMTATASDSDGTVVRVEFLVDGTEVAEDTTSAYAASWTAVAGTHTVAARAVDDDGATKTTSTVSITVTSAPPPPPPASITRTYTYDSAQRLCRIVDPESGATLLGYDNAGNLTWSATGLPATTACSASGNTAAILARKSTRTYDARNRLATLGFPDLNGNQEWTYFPDGVPDTVTTYNDAGASTVLNKYTYNKRRLPTSEKVATWQVDYDYDDNGHLSSIEYPDNLVVNYAPNALGQPTQAGTFATNVAYYPNGAIAGFTYGNGIVHTLTQNARGLPDRSRDADGSVSIHDDSYDYDKAGNVLAISDGVAGARGDRDLDYDDLNRLTSATSPMYGTATYTYDAIDNLARVQVTGGNQPRAWDYCYDTSNRLTNLMTGGCTGATVVGLGYDVQGNLANRNGTLYTFDYGNRLRRTGQETYRYDALGRRYSASNGAGTINSVYSQAGQLLYQLDGRSAKRRDYIYLAGSLVAEHDLPLTGSTETVTYQHTDALGSPVATTDSARTVLQRSEYEPYGALVNRPMQDGPGYTGHVTDAATGLVYMQQRYYDPLCGCFLSTDPVAVDSVGGKNFNRYIYAANSPYRFTDPDGRCDTSFCNFWKGVGLAIRDAIAPIAHAVVDPGGSSIDTSYDRLGPGENPVTQGGYKFGEALIVAETVKAPAEVVGAAINARKPLVLTEAQKASLTRFERKTPKAGETAVRQSGGNAEFSRTKPGDVPGSSATYTKVVAPDGTKVKMTKTTVDNRGQVVHEKDK